MPYNFETSISTIEVSQRVCELLQEKVLVSLDTNNVEVIVVAELVVDRFTRQNQAGDLMALEKRSDDQQDILPEAFVNKKGLAWLGSLFFVRIFIVHV